MRPLALAVLLAAPLLGCLAPPSPGSAPSAEVDLDDLFARAIEPLHDHTDASLHTGSHGMRFVSWSTLGVELGENGFANFVFHEAGEESLAFVALDGDAHGGFVIADISDPLDVRAVGRYDAPGNSFQEVRVVPGGEYALLNVQETPAPSFVAAGPGACSVCIHVVDVRDRAEPRLASVFPVDMIGTHNLDVVEQNGEILVYYVGQPRWAPTPIGLGSNSAPGNYVGVARFVADAAGARLVKIGEWRNEEAPLDVKRSFPHDVLAREHPLTGQMLLYVSHWEGGAILADATNPLAPRTLAVNKDPAPSEVSNMHWFAPEPELRDGSLIAWSAPEIQQLSTGTGVIRAYDVTNPERILQVSTWTLPGELTIPGQFLLSPHVTEIDFERKLLAVSHYHAGVWILDVADPAQPRAIAYYMPHGDPAAPYDGPIWWKKPNFDPEGFLPNVFQARWRDGLLWVTERGTGLYVLEMEPTSAAR